GRRSSVTAIATTPVRPVRSVRAAAFGTHANSVMAACTSCLVSGRMWGSPFTTRETVFTDTPARPATSRIVTRMQRTLGREHCGERRTDQQILVRHPPARHSRKLAWPLPSFSGAARSALEGPPHVLD